MPRDTGNYVSEWFGHRMYPHIVPSAESLIDQAEERCPFLSVITGDDRQCIKRADSRGVCTVSSASNGKRQDWLVCPYRALDQGMLDRAVRRLFNVSSKVAPLMLPSINLGKQEARNAVKAYLTAKSPVFIYFNAKIGGELSIPSTAASPEFSFDVTVIEIVERNGAPHVGRFGIVEIQTMDFHGSYRHAVVNLRQSLSLHRADFPAQVQSHPEWLSEGVEGPNIANVFKRTFYQMMFKFQLAKNERCAGCVLAIPTAVWESWQRHLGNPTLTAETDGTYSLTKLGIPRPDPCPGWIFVFEPDAASGETPNPIAIKMIIGTDSPSLNYYALDVSPAAALDHIEAAGGFLEGMARRLRAHWPELAKTLEP